MVFPASSVATFWYFLLVGQIEAMDIPEIFKQLWKKWDIRIMILLSLLFQVILILIGRLRKTSASIIIRICLWLIYLLADWVADFALGRLSKMDGSSSSSKSITAFWAPFLILHLGGPDTITAYSLEDNELWLRHLLAICFELIAAFYVFFRSLPNTRLLAPTFLIFFVGIIKYVERTYSLYKASTKSFRQSIGFSSKSLNISSSSTTSSSSATSSSSTKSEEDPLMTLDNCFSLYNACKPFFVDIKIIQQNHSKAKKFLLAMKPEEVLEIMDMELSFAYDELYTKAIVNHSRAGYVLRALCSICIWSAFFLYILAPKVNFNKVDMTITYVLLAASIFLDTIAIVMLVFSDWMVISLLKNKMLGYWTRLLAMHIVKIKIWWLKRRSQSREMPQLNLISSCLKNFETIEAPWRRMMNWIKEKLGIVQKANLFPGDFKDNKIYTLCSLKPIKATKELQEIIVGHVQNQFSPEKDEAFSALDRTFDITSLLYTDMRKLSLERAVFVCHIATELCFHWNSGVNGKTLEKDACRYLSNYMMHIVVMRPEMMSTMGGSNAKDFWSDYNFMFELIHKCGIDKLLIPNAKVKELCKEHSIENSDMLHIAHKLARGLHSLEEELKWRAVIRLWVMLLIKGVKLSKANMHLKQLSKGGEPLTLIWLLTKHLELGFGQYTVF